MGMSKKLLAFLVDTSYKAIPRMDISTECFASQRIVVFKLNEIYF
jgi:hypothetical protein